MSFKGALTILLLVVSAIANTELRAQSARHTTVKGRLTAKDDNAPIAYAVIAIKGSPHGTMSDNNGEFIFHAPVGTHNIAFTCLGYVTHEEQITLDKQQTKELNISLASTTHKIEEVVVQGDMELRQQKQGFAMNNIDMQKSIVSSVSTTELLNRSAGLKIRQTGGAGSPIEYNINGLTGNSVRVYIDGVPIRNYGRGFTVANIPPAMIERVEVYKGVVPAHLADDALGGAINVITKKTGMQSLNAAYSYGSLNTHNAEVNGQYNSKNSGFTAGASAYYNSSDNNYDVWGDAVYIVNPTTSRTEKITAERFNDAYKSVGINANAGFTHLKWADNIRLNLVYSDVFKEIQTGPSMHIVYGNRHTQSNSYVANLNYAKANVLPRLDVSMINSFSYTDRQVIDTCSVKYNWTGEPVRDVNGEIVHWSHTNSGSGSGEAGAATLASNLEENFSNRTNLVYHFDEAKNHSISLSGSFSSFVRNTEDPLIALELQALADTRKVSKTNLALSYDAKFFGERLKSSIFYKYFSQDMSLTSPQYEGEEVVAFTSDRMMEDDGYGVALSYTLFEGFNLLFAAERAIRMPTTSELFGNTSENIMPTLDLRPEQSDNLNLGFSFTAFAQRKNRLRGTVNFFYRNVTDLIQRGVVNTTDEEYGFENIGKILSKGVDVELKYFYKDRLTLDAAASYTDARFNLEYDSVTGGKYLHYGDRLRNMPYFVSAFGADYSIDNVFQKSSKLSFNYHLNYTHEFFKNWESFGADDTKATIPSQLTHDVGVTYRFPNKKLSLSIDAKNITDEQVFDNYELQKPGRMIFGKVSWKFF